MSWTIAHWQSLKQMISAVLQKLYRNSDGETYLQRSSRGQVTSEQYILSGQDKVYNIGSRMSGHPN
jgi:hypothetical protein